MHSTYVLDSFAILALLEGEEAGKEVEKLLRQAQQGKAHLLMTWVNVGEVIYTVERRYGREKAYQVLALLELSPVEFVPVDRTLALRAASIKATHSIAYADTFAIALAMEKNAVVVTGDPEFKQVANAVQILWLG